MVDHPNRSRAGHFEIRVTDANGKIATQELITRRSVAWEAYNAACAPEMGEPTTVELLLDGSRVSLTEFKCRNTPDAYRIRT